MSHEQVQAGAGWRWITHGWFLFTRQPGSWVAMALIMVVLYLILSWIPLLGVLAAAVIGPALFGGLYHGARELDAGRELEILHLFQAFRDSNRTGPMLMLGLVPLAAAFISTLLSALLFADGDVPSMMAIVAYLIVTIAVSLASGALLLFAIPRVMQGLATPVDAVQQSAVAVRDSLGAFLVLAAVYFGLAILATLPLGLGFLVLLPVMAGAVCAAHNEIFAERRRDTDTVEDPPAS
ncbi:MAG: BPSS1780 family membrane protein [Ectothiorhodospiraceae bacterium]